MNRQLKFRVWNKKEKKFEELDNFWVSPNNLYKCFMEWHPEINGEMIHETDETDFVFQQFTGLKDSKGVEIYEGDIVRGKFLDTEYRHLETINSEVVWAERYACFNIGIEEWRYSGEPVTIIGNIFESRELLENND
jgi:uncharacterized phage protein (TIGR01671 family)